MARPKSRNGGRVTPKGTRPSARGGKPQLDQQSRHWLELLEASAAGLVGGRPDADVADRWASGVQEFVAFPNAPGGIQPAQVLARAQELGGATAAAMTAALAAYGPARDRRKAQRQLDQLAASGDAPPWATAIGRATPVDAFMWRDEWGEDCAVTIRYERPDGSSHDLVVDIGWFRLGAARGFDLVSERGRWAAVAADSPKAEPVSLTDARALCLSALDLFTATMVADQFVTQSDVPDFEGMDLGFLAEQRLDLLPTGGSDAALFPSQRPDRSAEIDDFERSARPPREGDAEFAAVISGLRLFGLMCRDGDALHWTPCRVDAFVDDFIPGHSPTDGPVCLECGEPHPDPFDGAFMATVESAFPRWLRFAAVHCEQSKDHLEDNLAAAAECFAYWRAEALEHGEDQIALPGLWLPRSA